MTAAERQRRHRLGLSTPRTKQEGTMAQAEVLRRAPPPLPTTTQDLLAQRRLKAKRTINDLVEDVIVRLWEDKAFMKYVDAVYDSDTVEGSMEIDDTMAAIMIRETAKKMGSEELAEKKLDVIVHAMRVVLRRYGQDRRERRNTIGGQVVPDEATQAPQV
jgi:hypothetical protein